MLNGPSSMYQYSNMAPRLSGQTSMFGVVFFVAKSLLGIERQEKREKLAILTRKPRGHVRILIYRTWLIAMHMLRTLPKSSKRIFYESAEERDYLKRLASAFIPP